jgi:hypothetical protein
MGEAEGTDSAVALPKEKLLRVANLMGEPLLEPVELYIDTANCQQTLLLGVSIAVLERSVLQLGLDVSWHGRRPVVQLETHAFGLRGYYLLGTANFT